MTAALAQAEAQFQQAVVDLARANGWKVFHPFDSRRSDPGWPDLTLVRGEELLFRELKTDAGRLSTAQREWLEALAAAGANIGVWRPEDWDWIVSVLGRRW